MSVSMWLRRSRVRMVLDERYPGPRGIERFGYSNAEINAHLKRWDRVTKRWVRRYGTRWGIARHESM